MNQKNKPISKMGLLKHKLYSIYAEIISRLTVDRNPQLLPPAQCQLCGGNHHEAYCPRAKELGFLEDANTQRGRNSEREIQ